MLLDTGDSGALSIGYDIYRENTALFAERNAGVAHGLGGTMDTLDGELAHADIGGTSYERLPISAVRGQHVGHVGYGFIRRCLTFVLNVSRERIGCSGISTTEQSAPSPTPAGHPDR
jgi:hypothetical protein